MLYYIQRYYDDEEVSLRHIFHSAIYCLNKDKTYPFIEYSKQYGYKIYYSAMNILEI